MNLKFLPLPESIINIIGDYASEDYKLEFEEEIKDEIRDEIEDVKDEVSTKASTADLNKKFEAEKVTINETLEVFSAEFVNVAQHNVVNGKDVFKTCMGR